MQQFTMYIGLPGSGKSTAATKQMKEAEEETIYLSSDALRGELLGDETDNTKNEYIFMEMNKRCKAALDAGKSVIYDACNLSAKKRIALLRELAKYPALEKRCIIVATPFLQCLRNNQNRDRRVPEEVMHRGHSCTWNTPTRKEGWDHIEILYPFGKPSITPMQWVENRMSYQQDNPHHTETLGEHSLAVAEYIKTYYPDREDLYVAALIHDCGKPFTKSFWDVKLHQQTEIAHYFHHDTVGAYESLLFDYSEYPSIDPLQISYLIQNHMKPYCWEKQPISQKEKGNLGDAFYQDILILHEADLYGSIAQEIEYISSL